MRNKAEFRALRETVGMSQQLLADMLDVEVRSVKRWEHPNGSEPPKDAWDVLDKARERQVWVVDAAVDKAHEIESDAGRSPNAVRITYWPNAAAYEDSHPDEGYSWMMANANARMVALELGRLKFDVRFEYPEGQTD